MTWDAKIRELIDRLFIEANGNKAAFEAALREAEIEFVSSDSDVAAVPAWLIPLTQVHLYAVTLQSFAVEFPGAQRVAPA